MFLTTSCTNLPHNIEHSHGAGYLPGLPPQLERPCSSGAPNWSEPYCLVDTENVTIKTQIKYMTFKIIMVLKTKISLVGCKIMYSDTSANEDNSFWNHIR